MNALANELCSGILLLVRTTATRRKSSKHFPLSLLLLLLSVLHFLHQQGCKEKRVPLAQVRRLPFCLFSLVNVDGITTRVVRLLLSEQNFKALLLLLQHHNNMLSSIIHALFLLIGFSFFFLWQNWFSELYTIGGNQLWWHDGIPDGRDVFKFF
jgi:hypothetical protein